MGNTEFVDLCGRKLQFLMDGYGFQRIATKDITGYPYGGSQVAYANSTTVLVVDLEYEFSDGIEIWICRLSDWKYDQPNLINSSGFFLRNIIDYKKGKSYKHWADHSEDRSCITGCLVIVLSIIINAFHPSPEKQLTRLSRDIQQYATEVLTGNFRIFQKMNQWSGRDK